SGPGADRGPGKQDHQRAEELPTTPRADRGGQAKGRSMVGVVVPAQLDHPTVDAAPPVPRRLVTARRAVGTSLPEPTTLPVRSGHAIFSAVGGVVLYPEHHAGGRQVSPRRALCETVLKVGVAVLDEIGRAHV